MLNNEKITKLQNKENKNLKIKKCPDGHALESDITRDELNWYCDRCDENSKRLFAAEEESMEELQPNDDNKKQDFDNNETEKDPLEDENDDTSNFSEMSNDYQNETIFYREPNKPLYQCKECNFYLCMKCYSL